MTRLIRQTLVLAWLVTALTGCGGPNPAPTDITELTRLLTAADFAAVRFDDRSLVLKRDWLQVMVFSEDGGESLQAIFPHTGVRAEVDPAAVSHWNATRRFGRAYVDEDGLPVLASDLLLGDGVAASAVVDWATLVLDMAAAFAQEVWPVPATAPRSDSPAR